MDFVIVVVFLVEKLSPKVVFKLNLPNFHPKSNLFTFSYECSLIEKVKQNRNSTLKNRKNHFAYVSLSVETLLLSFSKSTTTISNVKNYDNKIPFALTTIVRFSFINQLASSPKNRRSRQGDG